MSRPDRKSESRWIAAAPWLFLGLGVLLVLLTWRDYGATWDEGLQARYGELCLRYFLSAGADDACNSFEDLRFYGPLFEMLPALFYSPGEPGRFEVRHLFLGLLAASSLPGIWLFARRLGGTRVALFSVLAAGSIPRFYGHWFNNPKDLPFAVAMIWFMVALGALFGGARLRRRDAIACGLATGLVLCARPGGLPLLVLFLGGGAFLWWIAREPRGESTVRAARSLSGHLLTVLAIAWPMMVLSWPWAHESPLLNPLRAIRLATSVSTTVPVLFEGAEVPSDALPRRYMAQYVLIGTPPTVLLLALVGLALGLRQQLARWRSPGSRAVGLTQMWFFVPLLLFALARPNVYGGMRHFVFVLPALGVLAGSGAAGILRTVRGSGARAAAWAALLVVVLAPVRDLVRLHPYQTTYYNFLAGGVAGAGDDYWTDYWLSSYREAIHWVNERAAETPERTVVTVVAAGPSVLMWAEEYAAGNVELVTLRSLGERRDALPPADFYIATTRNDLDGAFPGAPVVHTVGRAGAVFTVIKGRARGTGP